MRTVVRIAYYWSVAKNKAVAPQHYQDYDEFVDNPDPWSLNAEQAELRTLRVELRDSIEMSNAKARRDYYKDTAMSLAQYLARIDWIRDKFGQDRAGLLEFVKTSTREMLPIIVEEFENKFGEFTRITTEQAKAMAILMDASGKMAERHRKMAEQTKAMVSYDDKLIEFIVQFVAQVVIPNVPQIEHRAAIAVAAKTWLPLAVRQ